MNPRYVGDGNVGARNVYRTAGPLAGLLTLVVDVSKGLCAISLARWLDLPDLVIWLSGLAAVIGHDSMPLIGFHGGQGMAVIIGVCCALLPWEMVAETVIYVLIWGLTRVQDAGLAVVVITLITLKWLHETNLHSAVFIIVLISSVGIKKIIDLPMMRRLHAYTKKNGKGHPQ